MNTLSFGFSLVKDEVKPIDFIAVTAIQVFIPNLYKSIKENKDLFSGVRDTYQRSETSRKEEENRVEVILEQVDEIPRDVLTDFMERLFPRMENVGRGHSFLESWRKQGRICSPDIFDTYFKLFIPKDEISLREIERILSTGNDASTFSSELIKLNQNNRIIRFLERMEDYTREDIPEENIVPIINTLMDLGDLFPDGNGGFFGTNTPMRILRIFYQLSHRFEEHEKRFSIFSNAVESAKNSLYTIVHEIGVQCQQHGKYGFDEKPDAPDKTTVNPEQLDKLVKIALNKINTWASSGKLERHDHLLSILFTWRRWDAPKNVSNYAESLIETDKGLIEFIKKFLYDVQSHGMKDHVGRVNQRINLENVEIFVSLDEVDKRLREILSQPKYDELEDKERLAIKIFIDTRDGKIKDRF